MKEKICKLVSVYKKYGILGFVRKILDYISVFYLKRFDFGTFLHQKKYRRYFEELFKTEDYERIVVWRSSFGYQVPLFQRPQHIANQLANQKTLVFYEVTGMTDQVDTIYKYKENLFLMNFNNIILEKIFMDEINKITKPKYLQIYSTDWQMPMGKVNKYLQRGFQFIYEYIDHLAPELAGTDELPQNIVDKYSYAMTHEDVFVVTTADILMEDVISKRGEKNVVLASNGVDYPFFQTFDEYCFEAEFNCIIKKGKPILCYYGAFASWFDYELIKKIAATNKYSIVLFGVKYDGSFNENLNSEENIYFLGSREYSKLKYYAAKCDILMIPFLINDITKSTSPVKLFEYMALHKPIITTDMVECRKYKSVLIGQTHEEFISLIEKALMLKNDPSYINLLDEEAKENDWSTKAKTIIALLKREE